MTFRERRLLQVRDYAGLLVVVESYIRSTKSMMWAMPLLALLQTVAHGWIIPWRNGWDSPVSMRNIAVMGGIFVAVVAVTLSLGVSRLVKLERARVLLEVYAEEASQRTVDAPSGTPVSRTEHPKASHAEHPRASDAE